MNRIPNRILHLRSLSSLIVAAGVLAAMAGGCTVTSDTTAQSNTCSPDSAVAGCTGASVGYSCTGVNSPSQFTASLVCGTGVLQSNGDTDYCCNTGTVDQCSIDTSISCTTAGTTGYSCTGASVPDSSLSCGGGVPGVNDATDYCCTGTVTATCSPDITVTGCEAGTSGYSCTGSDTPDQDDPSLNCSAGTATSSDTTYCCGTGGTSTCSTDPTVTGCEAGTSGYSCTGTDTPHDADPSLVCSAGTAENGDTTYCCGTGSFTCAADTTVTGCEAGTTGYSCTGSDTPEQSDPSLSCSVGTDNNGDTTYCCGTGGTATCAADTSVTGCAGGSTGYSCTGTDTPDQSDTSLACSTGTADNGATDYCCIPFTAGSTCSQDDSVAGCVGSSFGFSCTGTDTPDQANSSLVCSTGTADTNGNLLYCCTD